MNVWEVSKFRFMEAGSVSKPFRKKTGLPGYKNRIWNMRTGFDEKCRDFSYFRLPKNDLTSEIIRAKTPEDGDAVPLFKESFFSAGEGIFF